MDITIGIDASRNRSGGAKAYLIGILSAIEPERHGIGKVHVWAFRSLLDAIPHRPWLVKHNPWALEQSLPKQLWWQAFHLSRESKSADCDILFATDASTLCHFRPLVVLSQDMLSYEPGEMKRFGWSKTRLRLLAILYLQNAAFRRAQGVIFLTRYAGKVIQQSCGILKAVAYIPHGVDECFKKVDPSSLEFNKVDRPIRCLYVSPVSEFKHQLAVVEAVALLRQKGYMICLELVGGGNKYSLNKLYHQIAESDPQGEFVEFLGHVPHESLPTIMARSHIFVFASSCETFGITLLEGMTAGLPIVCSNRSSLPETLENGGIYFDPESPNSIANAIRALVDDDFLRLSVAKKAKELSRRYSWVATARQTFDFIRSVHESTQQTGK